MSDESFSENFMWYEWGFVDPRDVRAEEAENSAGEGADRANEVSVSAGWDTVWTRDAR
jgi:hypothetical protein